MELNMIRPKNQTEDLRLSITKNCQTRIEQTHKKAEETLELRLTKPGEIFHFNPPISIEGPWMIGLTSLEVYNSIFNINATNNKFELYTDNFDGFSFTAIKDELEEIPNISDITPYHLQHERTGTRIIQAYRKLGLEKSSTNGFIIYNNGFC